MWPARQEVAERPERNVVSDTDAYWHLLLPSITWRCDSHVVRVGAKAVIGQQNGY